VSIVDLGSVEELVAGQGQETTPPSIIGLDELDEPIPPLPGLADSLETKSSPEAEEYAEASEGEPEASEPEDEAAARVAGSKEEASPAAETDAPVDALVDAAGEVDTDTEQNAPEEQEVQETQEEGESETEDEDEEDEEDEEDPRATSEFTAVLVAEPPSEAEEALARMSGDEALDRRFAETGKEGAQALAPTRSTSDIAAAALGPPEALDDGESLGTTGVEDTRVAPDALDAAGAAGGVDALDALNAAEALEAMDAGNVGDLGDTGDTGDTGDATNGIDVKATSQFQSLVLSDDTDTNIWDFSSGGMRPATAEGTDEIVGERYRIIAPLATGGMARIHLVRHLNLGKEFALKIIHSDLSSDAQMRKNFIREARVSSLLEHPNIVQVTDFGVDTRHGAYIVMELLRGESLHDRLCRERRLRLHLALDIALQVAEALHYMHQQNIIHCDIKPENIFLAEPPRERRRRVVVKLIDFGLSRREALGAQLASSEVGGTPHFMAPEQIRGSAPQPSMDIYALGVLLYEMVVGALPFDGELSELLAAQLHEEPPVPSRMLDEPLDEYVDQLILKALAKNPADRQPSMGQMIFEIRTVMEMLGFRSRRQRAEPKRAAAQEEPGVEEILRVFDRCPCPLFRIDTEPKILVANAAFCTFVGGREPVDPVGKPLDTTRLGKFYPNLRMDVLEAALNKTPIQRILTFHKDAERTVSVMIWLVPELDEETGATTFVGIIVPISALLEE